MDKVFMPYIVNSSKNVNTALFAYWLGFRPTIIHYDRRERTLGRSRWTFSKRLKFFIDSLLGFSAAPIRIISGIGLTVSVISMLYGLWVAISAFFGNREVPGFPTLAALLSFLLGVVILMLGVIGEYIWRIFDEVNKRPESVIDEIY
jgi:dolichol-phosphate mannosyltransferase